MSFIYRKTTVDREQCPAAHQTKQVPIAILLHWLQTTLCCLLHRNESVHTKVFFTYAIYMKFAIQRFMRRSVTGFLEVQYECIYLTSCIQNFAQSFITVINWVSQLRVFLKTCCLSDRSLCSSSLTIIFLHSMCSSILQGTHVKDTGRQLLGKARSPFL